MKLKEFFLNIIFHFFSENSVQKLIASENQNSSLFRIDEKDIPIMRDLKACLNTVTLLEKSYKKWEENYPFWSLRLIQKMEVAGDLLQAYQYYKIYAATSNTLSKHLKHALYYFMTEILPQLPQKLKELKALCTEANFDKAKHIFIEQMLSLEKYQENFDKRKKVPSEQKSASDKEDVISSLDRNMEVWLKKIFKENYAVYFPKEKTVDTESIRYYLEKKEDTETVKNIKQLSNGIVSIKKAFLDLDKYDKTNRYNAFSKAYWLALFIWDLRRIYGFLTKFEYEAIIAENASPLANKIKYYLLQLNDQLERLACIAEKLETDLRLKDKVLLSIVETLILKYQEIIYELNIPIDYIKQKRLYFSARIKTLETALLDISTQIIHLKYFLAYKFSVLKNIPKEIRKDMYDYLEKHEGEICMQRKNLTSYKKYLQNVNAQEENEDTSLEDPTSFLSDLGDALDWLSNVFGLTLHAEWMKTLKTRLAYLESQHRFVEDRLNLYHFIQKNAPFDFLKCKKNEAWNSNTLIIHCLKQHTQLLIKAKESSLLNLQSPMTEEIKTTPTPVVSPRTLHRLKLQTNELNFFYALNKKIETEGLTGFFLPDEKDNLNPKSILLIQEISDVLGHEEIKTMSF